MKFRFLSLSTLMEVGAIILVWKLFGAGITDYRAWAIFVTIETISFTSFIEGSLKK